MAAVVGVASPDTEADTARAERFDFVPYFFLLKSELFEATLPTAEHHNIV